MRSESSDDKKVVGIADFKVSNVRGETLVTFSVGSSVALVVYDAVAGVGGLLHYMLPFSKADTERAKVQPAMFGDTGIPAFFQALYAQGASKKNFQIYVVGGAQVMEGRHSFSVGKRNVGVVKKIFKKNGMKIGPTDVGGTLPRTIQIEIESGDITLLVGTRRKDL